MGMSPPRQKSPRELIVVVKPEHSTVNENVVELTKTTQAEQLVSFLASRGATIHPIAPSAAVARFAVSTARTAEPSHPLSSYYHVSAADDRLDELKNQLASQPTVEAAYIKPPSSPPTLAPQTSPAVAPTDAERTPDFSPRQVYLGPAPEGIDATYAWTLPGGRGAQVNVVDCEWSWNFSHEDLVRHRGGVVVGTPGAGDDDHGTAVIGAIIGNDNGFGVTGIAPDATLSMAVFPADFSRQATSTVIFAAADRLSAGDILLLEIHRPGPRSSDPDNSQQGYIAIEWWPDDFQAIAYAMAKGILVVEAGGNGWENLDDPVYDVAGPDFPVGWRNPFAVGGPDSGAILVGAGNPPAGTHGRNLDTYGWNETYVDRARCGFSNFGRRVDCQGWGWEVTTLGFGDLPVGAEASQDRNRFYTDTFAGTSSASPIVTGALACLQGALKTKRRPLLTPHTARELVRNYGSEQQAAPGRGLEQKIGKRPDLKKMLHALLPELTS